MVMGDVFPVRSWAQLSESEHLEPKTGVPGLGSRSAFLAAVHAIACFFGRFGDWNRDPQ